MEFFDDGGTGACVGCNEGRDPSKGSKIKTRSVRLENAPELKGKLAKVGIIKIDTQGHEPSVFSGMENWMRSPEAPPMIQFEFDVCLMKSAGRTPKEIVAFLQSLVDAGYTLADSSVSDFESKYYAFEDLKSSGATFFKTIDEALNDKATAALIEMRRNVMVNERPTDCAELVEWYCPKEREGSPWRTYTDVLASKPRSAKSKLRG